MERSNYLTFEVDWDAGTMHISELGPALRQYSKGSAKDFLPNTPIPITPIISVLECMVKNSQQTAPPFHFLLDIAYTKETVTINVHCTSDFNSVVNVPREQVEAVLRGLLTPRESQIAALLFEGCTIRFIACMLHITEGTVKRTIYNIHQKMGVGGQVDLVREIYARLAQMLPPPPAEAPPLVNEEGLSA